MCLLLVVVSDQTVPAELEVFYLYNCSVKLWVSVMTLATAQCNLV